jgi:hypothetical protein
MGSTALARHLPLVMPGLVPGIKVLALGAKDVDGRDIGERK